MYTELYVTAMAGVVLALFLMVSEVALLRKRASRMRAGLAQLYRSGKYLRLLLSITFIASAILIQPVLVGLLVMHALDAVNPRFSVAVGRELQQALSHIMQ